MPAPEQQLPNPFLDFFEENPDLFKPFEDLSNIVSTDLSPEISDYEPANDTERRLLTIIKDHEAKAVEGVIWGKFNTMRAIRTPGQTLTVCREILGRVLGQPLEGGYE